METDNKQAKLFSQIQQSGTYTIIAGVIILINTLYKLQIRDLLESKGYHPITSPDYLLPIVIAAAYLILGMMIKRGVTKNTKYQILVVVLLAVAINIIALNSTGYPNFLYLAFFLIMLARLFWVRHISF